MSFSGDLQGISLADVFQNISANQVTGSLQVRWRNSERFVRFEGGRVAGFSLGVGKGLPLVDYIRQRGYLDDAGLDSLSKKRKRSKKSPGSLIVEMGLLDQETLRDVFAEAVEENLYDLMALREAQFTFTEGDAPARVFDVDQRDMKLRLEPGPLLIEGARRKDEWERIQKVIGSDRDLFVVREGWDQAGLDEFGEQVAALLDGRNDIRAVLKEVAGSRFDVMKTIADLSMQGLARHATGDEIQHLVQDALAQGSPEQAVELLKEALALEPSNAELRQNLGELYELAERPQEAAEQFASLGYQAAQEDRLEEALKHYARAAQLNPRDVVLHERWIDLLVRGKDGPGLAAAVKGVVELLLDMGLADRARSALNKALDSKLLPDESTAREELAQVESSTGNSDDAAEHYLKLASLAKKDEARALGFMKKALKERRHDQALASRIKDIETGSLYRRRVKRRRVIAGAVAGAVLLALVGAGLMEITAAHRVERALATGLGPLEDGTAVPALRDLQDVHSSLSWTSSGRRAGEHVEKLVGFQLQAIGELLIRGEHHRAAELLEELETTVERQDYRQQFKALAERIELEREAAAMLSRAELLGDDDPEALAALEGVLADGHLLDFYLSQLPRLQCARARRAVLTALGKIDQARSLVTVAMVFVRERDPKNVALIKKMLTRAAYHRMQGHQSEWESIYPELERAALNPETRSQAREALTLLQGAGRGG